MTKMVALLMGTYYSFYLPQIINLQINYDFLLKGYISTVLCICYFLNPVVNPIIYAWFSPDFNSAFREILKIKVGNRNNICTVTGSTNVQSKRIRKTEKETVDDDEQTETENLGANPAT